MNKEIRAFYTEDTVRVYQAYNKVIANEAVKNGTFGSNFKLDRMTWVKPSFLWMMYRCGWGTKENQELYKTEKAPLALEWGYLFVEVSKYIL